MPDGIELSIGSETSAFAQGIDSGVIKPLQDAVTELGKLDPAADKSGKAIEDSLRASQAATQENIQGYRNLASQIKTTSAQATDDWEISTREQTKISREAISTVGETTKQQLASNVQGFDGTVSSGLSAIESTVIGIFGALPGAGVAVGVAVSAAIGLISAAVGNANAESENFEATVAALTAELEKTSTELKVGNVSAEDLTSTLAALSQKADASGNSLESLNQLAKQAGINGDDLADAYAGQKSALEKLYPAVLAHINVIKTERDAVLNSTEADKSAAIPLNNQLRALDSVKSKLVSAAAAYGVSVENTKQYESAVRNLTGTLNDQTKAQKESQESILAEFDSIGTDLQAKSDDAAQAQAQAQAEMAAAVADSQGKQTAAIKKARADEAAANQKANVNNVANFIDTQNQIIAVETKAGEDKIQIYAKFGADAAKVIKDSAGNPELLDQLAAASPADVQQILDNYSRLGNLAGTNFAKDAKQMIADENYSPPPVPVTPKVDLTDANSALRNWRPPTVNVPVNLVTRTGERIL